MIVSMAAGSTMEPRRPFSLSLPLWPMFMTWPPVCEAQPVHAADVGLRVLLVVQRAAAGHPGDGVEDDHAGGSGMRVDRAE
jgi:hypothetical protein